MHQMVMVKCSLIVHRSDWIWVLVHARVYRVFPWGCASGFLARIVPDAAPQHGLMLGMPHIQKQLLKENSIDLDDDETTKLTNGNNNSISNNNNRSASMLIQRLPSVGERVLWEHSNCNATEQQIVLVHFSPEEFIFLTVFSILILWILSGFFLLNELFSLRKFKIHSPMREKIISTSRKTESFCSRLFLEWDCLFYLLYYFWWADSYACLYNYI